MRDVAGVEDSHEEVRVITRLGGKPCVKLSVLKQADANTVEVAKAVSKKIKDLESGLPAGVRLGMVENQADYIEAALTGVRNAAIEGAILVILIVYLFLGSWRQALVMALALPITMILNFGLMKLAGFSLNIFSLGGLVVAIAVVLDNSIVVIENITRLKHESPDKPADDIAITATAEVGPAIVAATFSFIAIFVPFLLVPGLVSLLFRELILVIAGVVIISLLTAITLTPMLTAILLGKKSAKEIENTKFERFFSTVTDQYGLILSRILGNRLGAIGISALVLIGLVLVVPRIGTEFLPRMDDGRVMIKVRLPTGASVEETDKYLKRLESLIGDDPLVESYFTLAGGKVWGIYTYLIANEGEIDIQLIPPHGRKITTKEYVNKIRPLVSKVGIPGGMGMVMPMPIKGIRKLGDADIEVKIKGQDVEKLFGLAQSTANSMNKLAHFTNVYVSMDLTKPEYQILVDRERAAELGVSISDVANTARSLIQGAVATRYRDGDKYYNIRVCDSRRPG